MGFRPNTRKRYNKMFRLFIAFCVCINASVLNLSLPLVVAFMEFMIQNRTSYASLANHLSAIKSCMALYGLDAQMFDHPKVKMILRSLQFNRPITLSQKAIIDIHLLHQIVVTDSMYMGQIYKAIYLMPFFTFLCISNFAPHKLSDFNHTTHLAKGDVLFCPPGAKILIKWSKTIQTRGAVKFVKKSLSRNFSSMPSWCN